MELKLRPYQPEDIQWLTSWVSDEEILFQFAGPDFSFPIDIHQIKDYQENHKDRQFYMAELQKNPVAFGEIIPQGHNSVRLGRLLVGERGKGVGTYFVKALLHEAKESFFVNEVDLYVIKFNLQAIRCYEKAGFNFENRSPVYIQDSHGREHPIIKMKYKTE